MDAGHINCNSRTIGEYQSRPRTADTMGIIVAAEDLSLGGDGVVVDGSIKSVCDLKGKTVAFEPTIPGILLLQKRLKAFVARGEEPDPEKERLILRRTEG